MEKHRNLSYQEQLLEDINRAEQDRFEVKYIHTLKKLSAGRIQQLIYHEITHQNME